MMPDVRIRRLNLTVVQRAAPWSSREELAQTGAWARRAVLAELEQLLERALADWNGDEHVGAISIELPLGGTLADHTPFAAARVVQTRLHAALTPALVAARPRQLQPAPDPALPRADADQPQRRADLPSTTAEASLLALLRSWSSEDCLAERLALLAPATLVHWVRAVVDALAALPDAERTRAAELVASHLGSTRPSVDGGTLAGVARPADAAAALSELIALADAWAPYRPPESLLSWLPSELRPASTPGAAQPVHAPDTPPDPGTAHPVAGAAHDDARTPPPEATPASAGVAASSPASRPAAGTRGLPQRAALRTALPFLMLGTLSRTGWLATARELLARFEPAPPAHAHALAFALALKALPVPERGWRRAPHDLLAAAYSAGLAEAPPGAALVHAERALGGGLAALDAMVASCLVRGHDPALPLALVAVPQGIALIEPEGLFPIALGTRWDDVANVVAAAAAPLLIDPELPATIGAQVAAAGLASLTADPTDRYGQRVADAREALAALGPARPLVAEQQLSTLDRSMTLAAALALGDISWRLLAIDRAAWAEPEPRLALDRFGDLSATLIASPELVEIRLPIGPRSRDLAAAGLLADVTDVPWLGRRLRFGIG